MPYTKQQYDPQGSADPTTTTAGTNEIDGMTTAVCCGCLPGRRKWKPRSSWTTSYKLKQIRRMRCNKYADAGVGEDIDWNKTTGTRYDDDDDNDNDSMFFFDAVADELGPDEYPIVFTTEIQRPAPHVTFQTPETLLRQPKKQDSDASAVSYSPDGRNSPTFAESSETSDEHYVSNSKSPRRHDSAPIESHRKPSSRFVRITRRPTNEFYQDLEAPRVKIPVQGYPGDLTIQELAECQKFLRGLKASKVPGLAEQIYSMRDIEEEPYTICRWLRATKFDAAKILKRCEENQPMFDIAKEADFYPDVSDTIGAPFSIFLSQYPFLPIGKGRNGCPVNYFQVGKINPEGIMALTTQQQLKGYFWWSFMHKFKQEIRKAQANDPDFVRIEGINILDLDGLSSSAMTQETMDVIKLASKISDFFPETLHCMLILNAPGFFAMMWGVIKKFIDPRTAQRIQVFSSRAKGMAALEKMIDKSQIPVDYGGTNKSIKEAFREEAADPELLRQEVELIHVPKGKHKKPMSSIVEWDIQRGEQISVSIFTRSVSAADLTIQMNGSTVARIPSAQCSFENPGLQTDPKSNCIKAVADLEGPGTITVEAIDLDNAAKHNNSASRGYFLLVGNVKRSSKNAVPKK